MTETIGERVAKAIPDGTTRRQIAEQVGIPEDAFSRALHDKRGFSALELARLGEVLDRDVHELITGCPDPNRLVLSARHQVDAGTRKRSNASAAADRQVLGDVALAIRNASRVHPAPDSLIPDSLDSARDALGEDFVREFMHRLLGLGIDVVRVAELGTSYSLHVGNRAVIAVPENGNWFRENWDMAHELGHLVLGHKGVDCTAGGDVDPQETAANNFAAQLLLPEPVMRANDWEKIGDGDVAGLLWTRGVSTAALANRLTALRLPVRVSLQTELRRTTQAFLRRHWLASESGDPITLRMTSAATRSFPNRVVRACLDGVATGQVRKSLLAWVLGVDEDSLDVEEPQIESMDGEALMDLLA